MGGRSSKLALLTRGKLGKITMIVALPIECEISRCNMETLTIIQ